MTTTFHNTTNETGSALKAAIGQARTQEDKVEAYFWASPPGHKAGASRVHQSIYGSGRTPLTSTRRALSNLVSRGILVKTWEKTPGVFGRPECKYMMTSGQGELF